MNFSSSPPLRRVCALRSIYIISACRSLYVSSGDAPPATACLASFMSLSNFVCATALAPARSVLLRAPRACIPLEAATVAAYEMMVLSISG